MKIGDPLDRSTDHGPQNHKAHLEKLLQYCETGVKEGATLVYGGRQVQRPGKSPSGGSACLMARTPPDARMDGDPFCFRAVPVLKWAVYVHTCVCGSVCVRAGVRRIQIHPAPLELQVQVAVRGSEN